MLSLNQQSRRGEILLAFDFESDLFLITSTLDREHVEVVLDRLLQFLLAHILLGMPSQAGALDALVTASSLRWDKSSAMTAPETSESRPSSSYSEVISLSVLVDRLLRTTFLRAHAFLVNIGLLDGAACS
jgi:hypothetical protein